MTAMTKMTPKYAVQSIVISSWYQNQPECRLVRRSPTPTLKIHLHVSKIRTLMSKTEVAPLEKQTKLETKCEVLSSSHRLV
jgi:hypothetical protein